MWVFETQNILNLQWVTVETEVFVPEWLEVGKNHFRKFLGRQGEGTTLCPSVVTASQTAGSAWPAATS